MSESEAKVLGDTFEEAQKRQNSAPAKDENEEKFYCSVCGREIDEEEYESYEGMCWECWDDQLTEESDMMFGDLM